MAIQLFHKLLKSIHTSFQIHITAKCEYDSGVYQLLLDVSEETLSTVHLFSTVKYLLNNMNSGQHIYMPACFLTIVAANWKNDGSETKQIYKFNINVGIVLLIDLLHTQYQLLTLYTNTKVSELTYLLFLYVQ